MEQSLERTTALLRRTPAALDALVRGLPEEWIYRNEGEGTWNALQIVGHLAHGEADDWIQRLRWILEFGESQSIPKFDRTGFWKGVEGRELGEVLDDFTRLRASSLEQLEALNLQPADFNRRGRHSVFGTVTVSQLLATWAAHDATHLHQLARVLAFQYREAVGPWSAYLGVMRCEGHSAAG